MLYLPVYYGTFACFKKIQLFLSDNGTQMVGAEKELKETIVGWREDELKEYWADGSLPHSWPHIRMPRWLLSPYYGEECKVGSKAIGNTDPKPF